jgi:hypothetical protein
MRTASLSPYPIAGLLALALLSGCLREELPVPPFERGEALEARVSLQADYRDQVWYDLSSQSVVSVNAKTAWDLGFSCADSSGSIWLNSSLGMEAAPAGTSDFGAVRSASGLRFRTDHPSGHPDSLALRNALQGGVYVINRGYDAAGNLLGYRKVQFSAPSEGVYRIRYARLDGSEERVAEIAKDSRYTFRAYSLATHEVREIEPPRDAYDLCFTQYQHIFYGPYQPYLVTGVLINPWRTQVAEDSLRGFEALSAAALNSADWSRARDAIGYDWKSFSLQTNQFTVYPQKVYLIRDGEGFVYKLHFLDFYDENGQKGSPLFRFQRL